MCEREHRIPPPTVLNKLQIAHPYDTGTFLDLDTQGGTAFFIRVLPVGSIKSIDIIEPHLTCSSSHTLILTHPRLRVRAAI